MIMNYFIIPNDNRIKSIQIMMKCTTAIHCSTACSLRRYAHRADFAPGSTARGWAELRSATPKQLSEGPAVARHRRAMCPMEKRYKKEQEHVLKLYAS